MKTIVVGFGNQGRKRARVATDELVATVDPFNPEADYKSLEEIDFSLFDSALVCSPDEEKIHLLKQLLSKGKHVLVEKPLMGMVSIDELSELEEISKEHQAHCYTAYNHRFEPHFVAVKNLIKSGEFGKIYSLSMLYGNGTARDVRNSEWKDSGSGVLKDLGSHLLDTTLFFLGEKEKYQYQKTFNRNFENKSFDHIHMHSVDSEVQVRLEATLLSWRNTFRLDILAEKGSIHIDCLCKWGPSILTTRMRKLPSGKPDEKKIVLEQADPTWQDEYQYFKRLISKPVKDLSTDKYIQETLDYLGK